ncbi:MAG: winged helix-turn-helix domain-containing protein [Acidobacteriota bacterium]
MVMIRFGRFTLDPRYGELRRDEEAVPLAPQPFRLLLTLLSHPGELVTREELRQQVWGDGTFVDFERGLNFCVLQVRTALGDDAKHPAYIETLPRRGYRFIGQLIEEVPAASPPLPAAPARRGALRWLIAAAALAVVILGIAWQREPGPDGKTMLAVLPFDDLSATGDPAFADGMTEELLTHLGALQPQRLGVIARTSTARYRGTKKSMNDIGRELGVRYVVEGSVRREADRVRVTAQLIDARDQTHVWAESFDRSGSGALAIQRDVAGKIAGALRIELLGEDVLTARIPAAHDAYMRGRYLANEGSTPSVEAAVVELRKSVRLEPGFVLAHIALAESLHTLAMREKIDARAAGEEIRRAGEIALRLAPTLAQSHGITAMHRFWYAWDWEGAEESYRNAIRLNPNEPGTLHDHGWLLITRGAFDEGIAEIRRAQELDPVSPRANMHVAWAYIYTRRYAEAVREAQRALVLSPGLPEAYRCLEDAQAFSSGKAPRREVSTSDPYSSAVAFALAGDRDKALEWLGTARERRNLSFPLASVDPKLDALNGDPGFAELLKSAGLTRRNPSGTPSRSRASRRS